MTAKIINLLSPSEVTPSEMTPHTNPPNTWFESARFNAWCPTCNDTRAQLGYSPRTLSRLLRRDQPIEAHCVICNGLWAITVPERVRLAAALDLAAAETRFG
jgi:hypothetical protein